MTDTNNYAKCDDCGKQKKDVEETLCPFALEIHEEEVYAMLCDDCGHERAQDI